MATVKVQENGEVKIPADFRKDLNLKTGTPVIIFEMSGNLLLKRLEEPSFDERFEKLAKATQEEFKRKNIKTKDLFKAIEKVRSY